MKFRRTNKFLAVSRGYFWLPCPLCGQMMGGHEWKDVDGHTSSIPYEGTLPGQLSYMSHGICPDCTRDGKGCRAAIDMGLYDHACDNCRRVVILG